MSIEYPTFTYNNESVIIKPGNQFTNKQLRSRLHQMDVDAINVDSKAQLVNLYESTLKDDRNKFKLFDRLKKDTEDYYLKTGINLNKTMPMPPRNENINNPERSKVINLKYNSHSEPYDENSYKENNNRRQDITLKRPIRSTKNNVNITNAFFASGNYEQNNDDTYNEQEEDFKNNNYNNNNYNQGHNQNSRNFLNNETEYNDLNHTNNYHNIKHNDDHNRNYMEQDINYNNEKIYTNDPSNNYTQNPNNRYQNDNRRNINNISNSDNDNENMKVREPEEESNFSLFSGFSSFKNNKQIYCHILTGAIMICLACGFYYLYRIFSEQINDFFSLIFDTLTHPGQLLSTGYGYLRAYWYIIPLILIFMIIALSLWKRYQFKKRCKDIIKKIVEDLSKEEGERVISEEDIYRRYVQQYGISWEKFRKRYLPLLAKMRSKNGKLKTFSEIVEGKNVVFWEFQE